MSNETKEDILPVTAGTIAKAIAQIASATKSMYRAGLTEKTVILLVSEASGVCKRDVGYVLSNLYQLDKTYLIQPKAK